MSAHKLDLVHLAIRSGILGHIQFKHSAGLLLRADEKLFGLGVTAVQVRAMLKQFVESGGSLDVRTETREEYLAENPDDPFWYRAVIPVAGLSHGLFVEVRLVDSDPTEPWVEIVSVHQQTK